MTRSDFTSMSDEAMALAAKADREAFAALYDRYVHRIYRFCARRSNSAEEAEDATAMVFLRALERLRTYRGGSFAAWLFAVARTTLADRSRRGLFGAVALDSVSERADGRATVDVQAMEDEDEIRRMLAGLTEDQRAVVELRLSGLTGSEIALVLDRSPDSIKMLQLRAMKRLREIAQSRTNEETLT